MANVASSALGDSILSVTTTVNVFVKEPVDGVGSPPWSITRTVKVYAGPGGSKFVGNAVVLISSPSTVNSGDPDTYTKENVCGVKHGVPQSGSVAESVPTTTPAAVVSCNVPDCTKERSVVLKSQEMGEKQEQEQEQEECV